MHNACNHKQGVPQNGPTVGEFRRFGPMRKMPNLSKEARHGLVLSSGTRTHVLKVRLLSYAHIRRTTALGKWTPDLTQVSLN